MADVDAGLRDALGAVVVESARLEDSMRAMYAVMLDSDASFVVAAGQSFSMLHRSCESLQRELNIYVDVDEFRHALADAKTVYERRNAAIHGVWLVLADDMPLTTYRTRIGRRVAEVSAWTLDDLAVLAQQLKATSERVHRAVYAPRNPSTMH